MMFRCADYTRSGTARAGGEVTHPPQWSREVHAPDLALIYYKTADGCKAGWTCVDRHAPEGRGAERRLRVKTPDGCKGGWTCAKHAPRRAEDSMGRVRINYRYYNPVDGRWTRRDYLPAQYEHNSYCFAKNATTIYIDIYGLFAAEATLAGGAAVAGGAVAATAAVVVVGIGLLALTIWGVSTIVNNIADDATVDETESVETTKERFPYDKCERMVYGNLPCVFK